jgi:hypothetical protein
MAASVPGASVRDCGHTPPVSGEGLPGYHDATPPAARDEPGREDRALALDRAGGEALADTAADEDEQADDGKA